MMSNIDLVPITENTIHYIEDWLNRDRNLRILGRLRTEDFTFLDREAYLAKNPTWTYLIHKDQTPIGYARITQTKDPLTAELAIVIANQKDRHRGIGRDVARALMALCRVLKKKRILWVTADYNLPSIKLARNLGFKLQLEEPGCINIDGSKYSRLTYVRDLEEELCLGEKN